MKQNKTLKVNTIEKDIDLAIKKLQKEIEDLELMIEDKQNYMEELNAIKETLVGGKIK